MVAAVPVAEAGSEVLAEPDSGLLVEPDSEPLAGSEVESPLTEMLVELLMEVMELRLV